MINALKINLRLYSKKKHWTENPAGRWGGSGWELMDFLDFFGSFFIKEK